MGRTALSRRELERAGILARGKSGELPTSTTGKLCCSNVQGAPVTLQNPAVPGEDIYVFATRLGPVKPEEAFYDSVTGAKYRGTPLNDPKDPLAFVSSLTGGSTANVIWAGLEVGSVGIYRVVLELGAGMQVVGPLRTADDFAVHLHPQYGESAGPRPERLERNPIARSAHPMRNPGGGPQPASATRLFASLLPRAYFKDMRRASRSALPITP